MTKLPTVSVNVKSHKGNKIVNVYAFAYAVQAGEIVDPGMFSIRQFSSWTSLRKSVAPILRFRYILLRLTCLKEETTEHGTCTVRYGH